MRIISIVYHSKYGHTKKQAEAVAQGARSVENVKVHLVAVEEVDQHWETLKESAGIIFGSPVYMGSVSASFKEFMEKTSKLYIPQEWKNKLAAGFVNSGSQNGDKLAALLQLNIFAAQQGMIWVSLGLLPGNNSSKGSPEDLNRLGAYLGAMSQSNSDQSSELTPPPSDLKTAEHLGRRVALLAKAYPAPETLRVE
jgi:multimeric flavodoxin WrbA